MYLFPKAAVTNCHKLHVLKQEKFILSLFGKTEVGKESTGCVVPPLKVLRGFFFFAFARFWFCCHSLACDTIPLTPYQLVLCLCLILFHQCQISPHLSLIKTLVLIVSAHPDNEELSPPFQVSLKVLFPSKVIFSSYGG